MSTPIYCLIFASGEKKGEKIVIPPEGLVLGRDPQQSDYILPSSSVSRRHARFLYIEDVLCVEDLESTNGIIVNGEQITRRQLLKPGDFIQICEFDFYLQIDQVLNSWESYLRVAILSVILLFTTGIVVFWSYQWPKIREEVQSSFHSVVLKTEPERAEVYNHGHLIGRTPLILDSVPEGRYRVLFYLPDFEPREEVIKVPQGITIPIYTLKPAQPRRKVTVYTIPAGVHIFLNGNKIGTSLGADVGISAPFEIKDLEVNQEYQLYIQYKDQQSPVVTLTPDKTQIILAIWRPDHILTTKDGEKRLIMLKEKKANGDLVCFVSVDQEITVPAQNISQLQKILLPSHPDGKK